MLDDFISDIFNYSDLVAFGETSHGNHVNFYRKLFSISPPVSGIFLEFPIDYQPSINSWIKTGRVDRRLHEIIAGSIAEGKDIRKAINMFINFARDKDSPILCIDSSKAEYKNYIQKARGEHYFLKGKSRDEDMFNLIVKILAERGGKWFLIGGSSHIKYDCANDKRSLSLGYLLKQKLKSGFYNICLWKNKDSASKFKFYDCRKGMPKDLEKLMKKYGYAYYNESNKQYYDGYVAHA